MNDMQTDANNLGHECIFCKIVAGDIPAHKVYEDADRMWDGCDLVEPKIEGDRVYIPVDMINEFDEYQAKHFFYLDSMTRYSATLVSDPPPTYRIKPGAVSRVKINFLDYVIDPSFVPESDTLVGAPGVCVLA